LIFDYAKDSDDEALLTVVRTGQEHLAEVIRGYLKRISYGGDGWAAQLQLPACTAANVIVDPERALGSRSSSTAARPLRILSTGSAPETASLGSLRISTSCRTRSRTSSGLPRDSQPELFIDRSLGRHLVPNALRQAGATVHSMADVYGERSGQELKDEE
jgi:hypothetical protein